MTIRLTSFHPLCENKIGQNAVAEYGHKPYIDESCRREPDFEHAFPSITALCRQGVFAPYLRVNDIVVYMTVKGKWDTSYFHRRLVAILEVIERKETHEQAQEWIKMKNTGFQQIV
jgi:hypothetical protein